MMLTVRAIKDYLRRADTLTEADSAQGQEGSRIPHQRPVTEPSSDRGHPWPIRRRARLTAGFCWPWSNPNSDGTLVPDVKVGAWQMPWNAKPDAGRLAPGIPPSNFWASDPNGLDQVGCVYTAQGFEFDYVGVIWGRDLRWDPATNDWIGDPSHSHDSIVKRSGDRFTDLVKRTYRVLLTRGLKGCYVYFEDGATRLALEAETSANGRRHKVFPM